LSKQVAVQRSLESADTTAPPSRPDSSQQHGLAIDGNEPEEAPSSRPDSTQHCGLATDVDGPEERGRADEADLDILRQDLMESPLASQCSRPLASTFGRPGRKECSLESADTTASSSRSASVGLRRESVEMTAQSSRSSSICSRSALAAEDGHFLAAQGRTAMAPAHASPGRPGSTFRKGQLLKQDVAEWSQASWTLSEVKAVHEAPKTLKAVMQEQNAALRERLVRAREDIVYGCSSQKVRGIDLASVGRECIFSPR